MRTAGEVAPIAVAMRREARALDPAMPMFEVETLAAQLDASLVQERLVATLSSVFGLLALLLACWLPARRATKVDPLIALRTE